MLSARTRLAVLVLPAMWQAGCGCIGICSLPTGPTCTVERIAAESLPEGIVGRPYSFVLTHNCAAANQVLVETSWAVTGDLPPGITISGSRHLSGTPTLAGSFTFVVWLSQYANNNPPTLVESRTFTIVIRAAP